jgi:hypothetical protein
MVTVPVTRSRASFNPLEPSVRHANRMIAAKLAARLRSIALHNDAATLEGVATIEIAAALDAASRRAATPPPTVSISANMQARDIVEALAAIKSNGHWQLQARAIVSALLKRGDGMSTDAISLPSTGSAQRADTFKRFYASE